MVKTNGIVEIVEIGYAGAVLRTQMARRCRIRAWAQILRPFGLSTRWAAIPLLNESILSAALHGGSDNSAFISATSGLPLWRPHYTILYDPQPITNSFCVRSADKSLLIDPLKIREVRVPSGLSWRRCSHGLGYSNNTDTSE